MGFEVTTSFSPRNYEEVSAFTVNPMNGDTYVLSFDSGPQNTPDPVGDNQGDYDLYRFNFSVAYNDYAARLAAFRANPTTAPNPRGIMYTDIIAPDGFNYQTRYGASGYDVDGGNDGIPLLRSNKDPDRPNTSRFLTDSSTRWVSSGAFRAAATASLARPLPPRAATPRAGKTCSSSTPTRSFWRRIRTRKRRSIIRSGYSSGPA